MDKRKPTSCYSSSWQKMKPMMSFHNGETKKKLLLASNKSLSNSFSYTEASSKQSSTQLSTGATGSYSAQDFLLILVGSDIDDSNKVYRNSLAEVQHIVDNVNTFTDCDECVDFLTTIKDMKVFIVVSGSLRQNIVPRIHDMSCIHSIYIFCNNTSAHKQWTKEWSKVNGVFTNIQQICDSLKQHADQCNKDSIPMSFVSMNDTSLHQDLDQLEPSFMYSTLLKEILLELNYSEQAVKELVDDCREKYKDNESQLKIIEQFEREYYQHTPIWWYTLEGFTYQMLNRALRTLEVNDIVKMGFFVRDIHRHIEELHSKQTADHQNSFIVYRGQSMTHNDFDKMTETKGVLISFSNFLSTSKNREVSLEFVTAALKRTESVGVLFEITINPSILSVPFAQIDNVSYYQGFEDEVLFSMNSVFRIGELKQLANRVWHVKLTLTADTDPQLSILTKRIREEVAGSTGWHRLGKLMIKTGNFHKAEEVYHVLLEKTAVDDHTELSFLYNQLGLVKLNKAEYDQAIQYYSKSLQMKKEYLSSNHPDWGTSYNSVGVMYNSMGHYLKALSWHEKALGIRLECLVPHHLDLAESYNNIGEVYHNMKQYSKAISSYQKAREIRQNCLPPNHPDVAESYNNIAEGYSMMEQYPEALSSHAKSLEILLKSLPPNHPYVAISNDNIGSVYLKMKEFSKALTSPKKALEIFQQTLPPNHPDMAMTHRNLAKVYHSTKQYPLALQHAQRAVEMVEAKLSENHPYIIDYRNLLEEIQRSCNSFSV